jgi:subfamily B ATP-binding cassette protein MsbA
MFSLQSLKSLKPFIWPNRKWLLFSLLMAIPLSALRIGPIPLVKYLIDEILNNKNESKLILIPLGVIGMYLLNLIIRFLHYFSIRIVVVAANRLIKEKLYNHLISLSYDYYSEQKTGSLLSRVTADPAQLDQGIASLNVLIREPFTFAALLSYVFYTNWKLTLVTFSIVPLLGLVFTKTGRYVKTRIAEYQKMNGESYSIIQESISGIRVIHLYALRNFMQKKFANQAMEMEKMSLKISKIEELASPMVELVTSFAIALILYSGGKAVLNGEMTSGDLIAFFAAFGMMVNPIRQLSDINTKIHSAAGAMDRINHFLSWKSNVSDVSNAKHPTLHQGIELRNISFTYPNSFDRLVLKNVSFNVPSGKTVALVGQSGSGKSSIAQLLTRMYDVNPSNEESGIFIDGIDLRHVKIEEWRKQVAVVSQDVFLFHDTIYNNISLGNPDATKEEVVEAAKKAFAHDFIQRMPEGYETVVGDRGMKLSGGERQRISIARAFLRNSNLLILDEATSNLDLESEKIVQTTLETLMKGKTTVVIAHRLSTIRNADQIIVIREGQKVESGTYSELMDIRGEFYRLCQFSG